MKTKSSFAKIVLTIVLVLTCVMSFAACDDLVIKSISVTTLPTKVVYQIGEKFDPTGGKLTAVLADDKMLVIDINSAMCGDVDTSVAGKVEVKVGYLDKFATFEITVVPAPIIAKEVKDISVTTLPTKVEYVVGEAFCVLGGKITITYADGTTEIIDIDCAMCGNVDTSVAGKVKVKVGCLDKCATFEITVVCAPIVEKEVKNISVTTLPTKVEYLVGEAFSALGGKITVTYADDTTEIIDLTDSMCGAVDTSAAGKATVTATYETKTATFDIAVNKITPTITTAPTTIATVTYGDALPAITGEAKDGKTVVDGVFTLVAGQKLTVAQTSYNYTFTPTDTAKYATVTGTATITVAPKALVAVWDSAEVVATGSAVAPNATVVTGVASETITFTVAGNTNVGKYTATAVAVAGVNTTLANYSITNLTFDYTIADAFAKNTNQLTTALANAQDGSTIEVAAGTYNITVMDVVNNIIINGENIDTTILNSTLNLKNGQLKNLTLTNAKNLDLLNIGNSAATKINMTNVKVLFPIFTETDNVAASNRTVAQVVGNNKADITMRGCRFVNHANNGANITKVNEWSFGLAMAAGNVGSVTIDGCAFDGTFRTMLPSLNGKVTITNNTFRNTVESVKNGPSSGAGADVTCITTLGTGAITISGNTFDNCGGFYFQTTVAFASNTVKVDKLANFIQVSNGTAVKLDLSTDTFVCGEKTVGFYGSEANFTLPAGFTQYVGQEKINNVGWVKWNELKNVISIVVSKNPTQVEYAVGENFVATGGQITVTMKDTTTKVIDLTSAMCGVVDTAKAGTVTVTVTYETKTATFDIAVNKITPTITTAPTTIAAVTYGDALPTLTGEARDGDNVVVAGVFTLDAGQKLTVAQTSYNYTFTPNDTVKYTIVTGVIKFAVAAKALTITGVTAQNKSYDGTCDVVLENGTLTGKVGKDDVTLQLGKGTAVDKNAGASVSVTYTPSLLGVDKANYVIGDKNAVTVQVDKKFVKITEVIATERPYDSTNNITISGGVIVGMISGDQLGVDLGQGTSDYAECGHADNAVSYNDAKLTLADAGNYMINEWTSTKPLVKITRREITAGWPVVTLSYKGAAHDLLLDFNCDYKLTADSGIVGETIWFKDVTCDALLVAAVGKYTFTAHLISDRNFVISGASATKEYQVVESNVSKAEHYIATVDAIGTVVFTPECLAKIVAAEKEYSALAPELRQFGNVPYKHSVAVAARTEYDRLAKEVKSISVTTLPTKITYFVDQAFSALGGKITITYADGTTEIIDIDCAMCGVVDTAKAGTVTVTVTYETKTATFDIAVNKITPTITTAPTTIATVTYGDALPTLTGEARDSNNVVAGVFTLDAGQKLTVAQTSYNYTFTPNDTVKYTIVTGVIKFAVAAKALTITGVTADDRVYDGAIVVVLKGGTLSDVIVSEDVSFTLSDALMLDANVGNGKAVAYTVTLTGNAAANYKIGVKNAVTVNISAKKISVVWDSAEVVATGSAVAPNATVATGVAGQTITFNVDGNIHAGRYTATAVAVAGANTTLANYSIANLTFDYTIANAFAKNAEQLTTALANAQDGHTILIDGTLGNVTPEGHTCYDINNAVTIAGINGAIVYGTFNVKAEGVTIKDLIINVRGGGSAPLKNGINVISKTVTITNNTINLTDKNLVQNAQGVANGIVIWPFGNGAANYKISNNTINGFDVNTPEWISSGIVVAECTDLTNLGKPGVNSVTMGITEKQELTLATANTYTNCTNNYARQNWSISGNHIFTLAGKELQNTGVVYIPAGTYILNATLTIAQDDTRLIGIGEVILQAGAGLVGDMIIVTGKNVTFDKITVIANTGNTLKAAVATASDGSVIKLGAGNFAADLVITKSISLVGQGIANTTIIGSIVVSGVGKSVIIDGIKIYRETTNTNGIITITSDATVTVNNCLLEHKSAKTATDGNNTGVRMEGANSKLYLLDTDINVSHYCVGMRNVEQFVGISGGVLTAWAAIMTSCNDLKNVATLANNKVSINTAKLVGRPPVDDDGYGLITLQQNLHGNNIELNDCKFDLDLTFHNNKFTGKDYSLFDVRSSNNVITTRGCKMLTPFAITVAIGVNGVVQNALETGVKANIYDINVFVPAEYIASIHVLNDKGEANGVDLKYSPVIKINGHNYFVVETSAQLVDAVAKAVANDTIVLVIGTFAEAVTITQPLAIVGQGLDKTIITTCTIEQSAKATTLTGVTVTNKH